MPARSWSVPSAVSPALSETDLGQVVAGPQFVLTPARFDSAVSQRNDLPRSDRDPSGPRLAQRSDLPTEHAFLVPEGARSLADSLFGNWQRNAARDPRGYARFSAAITAGGRLDRPFVWHHLVKAQALMFAQSTETDPTIFAIPIYFFPIRSGDEIVGAIEIRRNRRVDGTKENDWADEYYLFGLAEGYSPDIDRVNQLLSAGYADVAMLEVWRHPRHCMLRDVTGKVTVSSEYSLSTSPLETFAGSLKKDLRFELER